MDLSDYDNHVLPPGTNDSWRTWLMTGTRRDPVDRRRVRGAHKGLKRMLVEGMASPRDQPYSWKEFSDAMVRQSVGDAVRQLPLRDSQVVKLAYFGGMSNDQIAGRLGISVASVERRLRHALGYISRQVEHGKSAGRRALGAVAIWLSGRWIGDATHNLVQASAVATVAVAIAVHPALTGTGQAGAPHAAHLFAAPVHASAGSAQAASASGTQVAQPSGVVARAAGQSTGPALPIAIPVAVPPLPIKVPVKPPVHLPLRA
jgi:RNA polymerase sigma factor (sigma-70 family)